MSHIIGGCQSGNCCRSCPIIESLVQYIARVVSEYDDWSILFNVISRMFSAVVEVKTVLQDGISACTLLFILHCYKHAKHCDEVHVAARIVRLCSQDAVPMMTVYG